MIVLVSVAAGGTWDTAAALRSHDRFVPPTDPERAAWSALVADLARSAPSGAVPPTLDARARALGFALSTDGGVALLADDGARGAGLYAVRLGALPSEVVLQAPHPFDDLHTGALAGALFDAGGLRALVVATADRDLALGSDPAHAPASWFQSATDGLAAALPRPLFLQLHGFAATTSDACAVVSEGPSRMDPARVDRLGASLGPVLDCAPVRTGREVPALAARTNAQGRLLVDRAPFLHVELSLPVRQALVADAERRARLHAWVGAVAEAP